MPSPLSIKQKLNPTLLVPIALADYSLNFNKDKTERIYLTFCILHHWQHLKRTELLKKVEEFVGTRAKEYVDIIADTGIDAFDDNCWLSCKSYPFTSPEVVDDVNRLLAEI